MRTSLGLTLITTLVAGSISTAFAAESADLAVRGTIRPSACNISLSSPSFDFGTISAQSLSESSTTTLPTQTVQVAIACDAPTAVAINFADNRNGTEAESPQDMNRFGLGLVNDTPIGHFELKVTGEAVADGNAVDTIGTTDGITYRTFNQGWVTASPSALTSWASVGSTTSGAYQSIQHPMTLLTKIRPKKDLPALTGGIPIDGSATIALVYL